MSVLKSFSVPQEQSKIARHFNAGTVCKKSSPAGTTETNAIFNRPCGTFPRFRQIPALKRRAIFKMSLWDTIFSIA
jgi:hypothetical protein